MMLIVLMGCSGGWYYKKGTEAIKRGKVDEGLATLEKGVQKYPRHAQLRAGWFMQKLSVVEGLLARGDRALAAGKWDAAIEQYRHVLQLDPVNARGAAGLEAVVTARSHAQLIAEARALFDQGREDDAEAALRQIFAENPSHAGAQTLQREIDDKRVARTFTVPTLNKLYQEPVTLELRDTNIKMAMEILSKMSGVNFALDQEVRPDIAVTLFVHDASLEDAVNLMLDTYQLKKKIINDKTVLIYPDVPAKLKEYEELAVKAIHLTNVDAQKMLELIRTFLKTKDIVVEPRLNVLILRDGIEAIHAVEKLVALLDVPEPEVMLEVEVLEIHSSRLHELGIRFPDQVNLNLLPNSESSGAGGAVGNSGLTLDDFKGINSNRIGVSGINATINLKRELSDTNVLANPSIRARNHEKAKIKIGDRLPVITTTQNVTSNSASDSVQYLDVGLSVEVEPDVRMDNEVAIKLGLEVSNVVKEVRGGNGSIAYQIGTRNVNTVLRLKDGETQILGGLIRDDENQVSTRIPGLGDLPLLGRLFSNDHNEKAKTEIVLAITPHILRNIARPAAAQGQFWSGTEERFTLIKPWQEPEKKEKKNIVTTPAASAPPVTTAAPPAP